MEVYDIAIIGTGPAGLSAAVTAKMRNKDILLIGNRKISEKVSKAQTINNYLGIPEISGEELSKKFEEHIKKLGIEMKEDRVSTIYPMGDFFGIQMSESIIQATTVILATGVSVQNMIDGEKEFLGKGVSYCATCDAMLYRDRTVAVIGYSPMEEKEAEFLSEIASTVYYIPMYEIKEQISHKIQIVKEKPLKIEGDFLAKTLLTDKNSYDVDGVFVLRENVSAEQLINGLKMNGSHVEVNLKMETNIPGCFACGDIAGTPYQYIKSAGQGNIAALSAVGYCSSGNISKNT